MRHVLPALVSAIGQLGDRRVIAVLGKSLAVTLAIMALLGAGLWHGANALIRHYAPHYGEWGGIAAVLLVVIAGWLLFRIVALAVIQFFADEVVLAVEARHYPAALARARTVPWREELRAAASGLLRAVAVNAVALPFALALLVTGIGTALLFWAVNAWLLGNELAAMVALRHRARTASGPPLPALTRFTLGGIVAAMLLVPIANFVAPVIGAAMATHLFHRTRNAG